LVYVGNVHRTLIGGMRGVDHRAVQAEPDLLVRPVQFRVVDARRDDVFHGRTRYRARHQLPYEQPRDRGVAVGEVEDVGLVAPAAAARQGVLEARYAAAVGIALHRNRRYLVHADTPVTHAPALVHLQHLVI